MPSKRNNNNRAQNYGDSYSYYDKNGGFEDIYSGRNSNKARKKNQRRKIRNAFIIVFCVIFAISGGLLVYGYNSLSSINYSPIGDEDDINELNSTPQDITLDYTGKKLLNDPMVLNVMLFGSDNYSAGDGGRSDSMLMISIDNRRKKLKATSFLRDMWVKIPGYGEERINTAYTCGGPKLAVQTVEANFGINIDRYVVIDFPGFESIINRLGGIDMELTEEECEYLNEHCSDLTEDSSEYRGSNYQNPEKLYGAGIHHLNGLQALNHARNRDSIMSDFDRTSRQRDVISAVVQKMKTASVPQIIQIISDVGPMITTNLKKNEVATLATNAVTYMNYPMEEYSVPGMENFTNLDINGAAVLGVVDMDQAKYDLAKFIFEDSIVSKNTSSSKNSIQ